MRKLVVGSIVLFLVHSGLLLSDAGAGERDRPIRIGVLTESWGPPLQTIGLRDGLIELGYKENEDFVIGVRFTQGDLAALPTAADALVQYGVDLLFVSHPAAAKAAQQATTRLPIVFAGVGEPVGLGLVQSFARPGGNITGVTGLHLALSPKRLEVFREIIPGLKQVLYLYDASDAYAEAEAKKYREAARQLEIRLIEKAVRTEAEAKATLAHIGKDTVHGILAPHHISLNIWGLIMAATSQRGFPNMFGTRFMVEGGALASYGPNRYEIGSHAARLVDKILKGKNPSELAVEVNSKTELVINLKTAKTLGLTIPPEVLYRADRLIR